MSGTIKQDPNGTWWFQVTITEHGTRRHIRRRGSRVKKDAQRVLTELLAAHGKGDTRRALARPSAQPLGEYLDAWLSARRPSLRASTAASYETIAKAWIKPHLGKIEIRALSGERISAWHALLRESGARGGKPLGTRSVAYASRVLSMALADAVESGKLAVDPMTEVPKRQRPRHRAAQSVERVWDTGQARAFLTATREDRLAALWCLYLDAGCRRGEALALTWHGVDLDAATVTISGGRVFAGSEVVETDTKSHQTRVVDLAPGTIVALRAWRRQQATERLAAGRAWTDTDHVFTNEIGEPLRPDSVSDRFARLVADAGLPTIRLHDTRHTCGTILLTAGQPLHVVAQRLGHDPAVLLRTYAHVLPGSGKDAAAQVQSALYG